MPGAMSHTWRVVRKVWAPVPSPAACLPLRLCTFIKLIGQVARLVVAGNALCLWQQRRPQRRLAPPAHTQFHPTPPLIALHPTTPWLLATSPHPTQPAPLPPHPTPHLNSTPPQVCGAELFTGNTALLPAAVYEGKATVPQLIKNW